MPNTETIGDVAVYRWKSECWNCGDETPVVWPRDGHLDDPLGESLAESDETNVARVFSKSQDREVWGNVCMHCGAYQGNHYLEKEVIQQDPPEVECDVCGALHEWYPDDGIGDAFGQGWIDCPDYGSIPTSDPRDSD